MFYGIIIRMYYAPGEHNPPHLHAYYNEYKATIALDTLEILEGKETTSACAGLGRAAR